MHPARVRAWDVAVVLLLGLGATAAAAALSQWGDDVYRFLLGDLDPVLTTLIVSSLGVAALIVLARRDWFSIGGGGYAGLVVAAFVGCVLTIPVIIVDLLGGFPADMNVPAPESLLFYPSIALVAEFAFHVVPLAILASVVRLASVRLERARLLSMIAVSTIEPTLQVMWGAEQSPLWANAYVGAHLLVFNLVAVHFFRRYGFLSMYAFRVAYYLIWHIAWGFFRLSVLFGG